MPRNPNKIYRGDRKREAVWEALDALQPGREFTLWDLWNRGRIGARFPMTEAVLRDAVRVGAVECECGCGAWRLADPSTEGPNR